MIAAVEDQSADIRWHNGSSVTTGATATDLGTGSANTDAIILVQGETETSYAAGLARAYTGGGYTDWFLPSKAELNKMWLERETINTTASANGGSNFSNNWYWSSTEHGSNITYPYAWIQHLSDGETQVLDKSYSVRVRAVRAF